MTTTICAPELVTLTVAIYARFKRVNGQFSCQLILSRSKLIPDGTSQPRAELCSALLNTHTGEVVKRALRKHHSHGLKLTDSQIVLHWISNEERQLKQWVRNRVIEVKRFTEIKDWYHIDTKNMIADIATRKGSSLDTVSERSQWINGYDWMKLDVNMFPIKSRQQVSLSQEDIKENSKETSIQQIQQTGYAINEHFVAHVSHHIPDDVQKRYEYSCYLINPFMHRFQNVVRVMGIVLKFIRNIQSSKQGHLKKHHNKVKHPLAVCLTEEEINNGKNYFFKKATNEIKKFMNDSQYKKYTREKDGILMYVGRILPSNNITVVGTMTSVMKDLSLSSFCVPVIDKHSPLAYSIINDIHWYSEVRHQGVEIVWRHVLKVAFIIEGQEIVKKIRKLCERCRYLMKRTIDIAMGPVSDFNMVIAPAFYITQVDLAGPFQAFSQHHKRTTVKVWLSIFCCTTTSSGSIKVMEDYSSTSFIQAFTRFSCDVGYPKMLLPDMGSQLVKSCENMRLNFHDIKFQLHKDVKVEFEVCPVGGHHMHGKVERKIREVKLSLEKLLLNERISILQWETISSQVANSINNLPIGLGNYVSNFDTLDLITPNRLKLGRNNNRSPVGTVTIVNERDKILENNSNIFNTWFENWLVSYVPRLMHHPKWYNSGYQLNEGDIVLFLKQESVLSNTYQYGMVISTEKKQRWINS